MDRLLMAPCTSPSSKAFVVPIAWALVPKGQSHGYGFVNPEKSAHQLSDYIPQNSSHNDNGHSDRGDASQFFGNPQANGCGDRFRKEGYILLMGKAKGRCQGKYASQTG